MTTTEKNTGDPNFDWATLEQYSAGRNRVPNPKILKKHGDLIYNHEPYALDMYEAVFLNKNIESKEPNVGELRTIIDVFSLNEKKMQLHVILTGLIDCIIDLGAEKTFFASAGFDSLATFVTWINTENGKSLFLKNEHLLYIENVLPYTKGSISKGQASKMRTEFFEEIKSPTSAYMGKILEKNGGGFIIDVQGVRGFLPGSLAATNIVRDFDTMIGKEIPVVVEDFLKDSDTFVFSYKKYVSMILPSKTAELDTEKQYTGSITGIAKFGIFVEFDDIFTGLIHTSKMTADCKNTFNERGFKPGDKIDFWIKEITPDKKIILTDEDPSIRRSEIEEFKLKNLGHIKGGEVVSIQPFGTLVKLQKDICGMISQKEIKTKKKNYAVGDTVMVSIDRVHNDKIFLSIPSES